jgi:hypothetical protein
MSNDHLGPAREQSEDLDLLGVTKNAFCVVSSRVIFHTPSMAMKTGE